MKISLVINVDTRPGCEAQQSRIGDPSGVALIGCRSLDFLVDGVRNHLAFFAGYDLETLLFIDEHLPLPEDIGGQLGNMILDGELTEVFVEKKDHTRRRWNDYIYLDALRRATGDIVVHLDGDTALFRHSGFDPVAMMLKELSSFQYVCGSMPLEAHGMTHASTRFFMTERAKLNLDEAEAAIDDRYRQKKYGTKHAPCLEHVLGLLAGDSVLYPLMDPANYLYFSWVHYYQGVLAKLNASSYEEVNDYVFRVCGGIHGASDLIGQPL